MQIRYNLITSAPIKIWICQKTESKLGEKEEGKMSAGKK